ncbi:hypothetical protein [Enterovirga sp. CN4-39]|uniref:hypothetical protein n=1 Tax=Enterovirga sp. CN4-39 TaxID=3400910 RepID=UPI003C0428A9
MPNSARTRLLGAMPAEAQGHARPEVEPAEIVRRDLTKQIRKLRWIGRADEAQRLELALAVREHALRVRGCLQSATLRGHLA